MKNVLFISLLISIDLLIVSCLGLGDSQKCDKFVEDYHNPAVDKYEEFAKKLKSYYESDPIKNLKNAIWGNYSITDNLSFDSNLDVTDINTLNDDKFNGHTRDINDSEKSFNSLIKLGDEAIDAFKKITDNDSEVCKNKSPKANTYEHIYGNNAPVFRQKPGDSDYQNKVGKLKKDVEKVMEINKAFRSKAKTVLGL